MAEQVKVVTRRLGVDNTWDINTYMQHDGYRALETALKETQPDEIIELIKASGLRGRGGAAFPCGMKWSFMPKDYSPKYFCCNADESEPGTAKDRVLLEQDPHAVIEGLIIGSYAIGADKAFIYIRGEMPLGHERLTQAVKQAYQHGYLGDDILGSGFSLDLIVHRGAGAYICGEETALLSSLEGSRGEPKQRPPFPANPGGGLYRHPTIINNTETLATLPPIVLNGADWYRGWGTESDPGTKIFPVSGHVNRPGLYELPVGTSYQEIIYEHAEGILGERNLKAVIPGGASMPMLDQDLTLKTNTDFDSLRAAGTFPGSAAVIVMAEGTCMVKVAWRLALFYQRESCGKCTPCREGTRWLTQVLERVHEGGGKIEDLDLLNDICTGMGGPAAFATGGKCFCLLGDSAAAHVRSSIKLFRDDYEMHINEGHCPEEGPLMAVGT